MIDPNIPSVDTPEGADETANKVLRSWRNRNFHSKRALRNGKVPGQSIPTQPEKFRSRYAYLKGDLSRCNLV